MRWEKIDPVLAHDLRSAERTPNECTLSGFVHIRFREGDMVRTFHKVSYHFIDILSEQSWVLVITGSTLTHLNE